MKRIEIKKSLKNLFICCCMVGTVILLFLKTDFLIYAAGSVVLQTVFIVRLFKNIHKVVIFLAIASTVGIFVLLGIILESDILIDKCYFYISGSLTMLFYGIFLFKSIADVEYQFRPKWVNTIQ